MRNMLHAWRLNLNLWGKVTQTSIHVLNRIGSRTHEGVNASELWTRWKPLVGYLKKIGCMTYAFLPKKLRKKLDPKFVNTIFVGYSFTFKACKLSHPLKKQIIICRDVLFQKEDTPKHANNSPEHVEFFHVTIHDVEPHATLEPIQVLVQLDMSTKQESFDPPINGNLQDVHLELET